MWARFLRASRIDYGKQASSLALALALKRIHIPKFITCNFDEGIFSSRFRTLYDTDALASIRSNPPDKVTFFFHNGPRSVGRNHPTMDVTIHMTTAMMRDLIHPIEYSICNASNHTIPAMNAASSP